MIENSISFIWGIGALILVISSLVAQKLPIGKVIKMTAAWIGIFSFVFVLFLFQDEGREVWRRVKAELSGERDTVQVVGASLRIARNEDGHYWVKASVNGTPARFMIDSGATTTTLSLQTAKSAKVELANGFPVMVETANGTVELQRARVDIVQIGTLVYREMPILIGSDTMGDVNLLGMDFLSSLRSWKVERATLILEP